MAGKLTRPRLLAAAAAGCVAVGLAAQLPADAAPGPGTWTAVTTPAANSSILSHLGHEGHLTVAGKASPDVTSVTVYCLRDAGSDVDATTVATAVVVFGGRFQATVPVPITADHPTTCRLRALPDGVSPQNPYLSSYAGPKLSLDVWNYLGAPGNESDFFVQAGRGTGQGQFDSVNACAVTQMATSQPDLSVVGGSHGCLAYVGTDSTGTVMEISVDGHPVYATHDQLSYDVPGARPVHFSVHKAKNGTVTWRQTDDLLRCASDTFPPTGPSCTTAKSSGVSLRREGTYGALDGHQVRLDDAFVSTDGKKHRVRVSYQSSYDVPPSGQTGLRFPGSGSGFTTPAAGQKLTVTKKAAATLLIRSNTFADEGDPGASTWALTWSRTVSTVRFDPDDQTDFGLPMSLHVPADGSARLRFVASEAVSTSRAAALAGRAERAMMANPRITSPAEGVVIHGTSTTVKGVVRAGANGLPTSVTVNGHAAKLTPHGASRGTFTVTFTEGLGKHTIEAVAHDAGGNTRATSVKVRNI